MQKKNFGEHTASRNDDPHWGVVPADSVLLLINETRNQQYLLPNCHERTNTPATWILKITMSISLASFVWSLAQTSTWSKLGHMWNSGYKGILEMYLSFLGLKQFWANSQPIPESTLFNIHNFLSLTLDNKLTKALCPGLTNCIFIYAKYKTC